MEKVDLIKDLENSLFQIQTEILHKVTNEKYFCLKKKEKKEEKRRQERKKRERKRPGRFGQMENSLFQIQTKIQHKEEQIKQRTKKDP